jgi:hypothetical protein
LAVWSFLQTAADPQEPLLLIGFSAGVVGAIAAANLWQGQGRRVAAVIAVDGWGVPQVGDFPLHRVSHDYFTHWSSAVLGAGADSFYADPARGASGFVAISRSRLLAFGCCRLPTSPRPKQR